MSKITHLYDTTNLAGFLDYAAGLQALQDEGRIKKVWSLSWDGAQAKAEIELVHAPEFITFQVVPRLTEEEP